MQRTLSTQLEHEPEMLQRHNLFHTFLIVKDCRVCTIIDSGSCNNLVSLDLVKKLGLTTYAHSKPYHLEWFNNSGKEKVTRSARIHYFIADFDVVPMQACSLLLGHSWDYDTDALLHGRTNTYSLLHKGKKIVLLPLTPAEIVKQDKELAENVSNESSDAKTNGIKLKEGVYIATTYAAAKLCDNHDAPCYTMLCRYKSAAVTNLLQEIDNGMESRTTPIQEGEDDEDIAASDTYTLKSDSSLTWTSFPSRIPETVYTKNDATATY